MSDDKEMPKYATHVLVDFDGTLAHYDHWRGVLHTGKPIAPMVARVKRWLADGEDVRIFTARVAVDDRIERAEIEAVIQEWCREHLGKALLVTCIKNMRCRVIYDDRCRQVIFNTGEVVGEPELVDA